MSDSIVQNKTVAAASAINYQEDRGLKWRRPDKKKRKRSIFTDLTCSVLQQNILCYCLGCWRRHLPPSLTTDRLSGRISMDSSWKTTVKLRVLQPRTSVAKGTPHYHFCSAYSNKYSRRWPFMSTNCCQRPTSVPLELVEKKSKKNTKLTVSLACNCILFWHRNPSVMTYFIQRPPPSTPHFLLLAIGAAVLFTLPKFGLCM